MSIVTKRCVWLAPVFLVAGCELLVPLEEDPVYIKVNQVDTRLARVERILENQSLMSLVSELEQLRQATQELRNDVETLQHSVDQGSQRQRALYQDIDQRLQAVEKRNAQINVLDGGSLDPGQLPLPGGSDRSNYQAAFELLKQGRYDQAGLALEQFLVAFPDSGLSDNAQYWLAETHYVSQRFEQALPEFLKVLDQYPDSHKIPDALLKIGYCNYELGEWDEAKQALRSVTTDYPETTAARLADQRMDRMASEGH